MSPSSLSLTGESSFASTARESERHLAVLKTGFTSDYLRAATYQAAAQVKLRTCAVVAYLGLRRLEC